MPFCVGPEKEAQFFSAPETTITSDHAMSSNGKDIYSSETVNLREYSFGYDCLREGFKILGWVDAANLQSFLENAKRSGNSDIYIQYIEDDQAERHVTLEPEQIIDPFSQSEDDKKEIASNDKPKKPRKKKNNKIGEPTGPGLADEYAGVPTARSSARSSAICPPNDRGCWQKQIELLDSVPNLAGCGEYIDEAENYERNIDRAVDPNLPKMSPLERALANPPPPVGWSRHGDAHASSSISKPSGQCVAEWNGEEAIPTLACTESVLQYERWSRDGLAKASDATYGLVGRLPIISTFVFLKQSEVSRSTAHNSIWAARWLDFMRVKHQKGDYDRIDEGIKMLGRSERQVLLARIRKWYNEKDMADYRPLFTTLLQNYFIDLYPEAADENGLPAFEKMPTRLWWATNWLATVKRRGMPLPAALNLLRCTASSYVAVATLKGLIPYLKSTGRFRNMAEELEILLADSPPS